MEKLDAGEVVIGDGSYVFTLEKRGYVQASKYTNTQIQIQKTNTQLQLHIYKYTNENTQIQMFRQANTLRRQHASIQKQFDSLLSSLREQEEMSLRLLLMDPQRVR